MIITEKTKCPIAEGMFGLFFEDINYALDGGLHAEMIENRGFEFFDCGGERYHWYKHYDGLYGWQGSENASLTIAGEEPLYRVNPHYLCFHAEKPDAYFTNKAYDGIFLEKGKEYHLSFYARSEEKEKRITAQICKDSRAVCSQSFANSHVHEEEPRLRGRSLAQKVLLIHAKSQPVPTVASPQQPVSKRDMPGLVTLKHAPR